MNGLPKFRNLGCQHLELQETSKYIENDELLQLASPALTTTEMTELLQFRHPQSLFMVLHGPAGTGKSQVINALKCFVKSWELDEKLMICATTGSAAILLGAQTYQSALWVTQNQKAQVPIEVVQ